MSETVALFRIAIASNRLLLSVLLISLGLAQVAALLTMVVGPDSGAEISLACLYFVLLPAVIASIVLFDYRDNGDMNLPESGCSHWLLRTPVRAWKIAIVPVVLRTAWVFGLWLMFAIAMSRVEFDGELPLIAPPVSLAAAAIWVLVIAWRPFRSGWRRLAALAFAVPLLYLCFAATFAAPNLNQVEWRPIAIPLSIGLAFGLYLAGVWVAIRSVALARTCTMGLIPAHGRGLSGDGSIAGNSDVRLFRGARHALIHHDWIKSWQMIRRVTLLFVAPGIVAATLLLPLHIVSLVVVLVAFAEFAVVTAWSAASAEPTTPALAPYLAASPLRSATIAWSRMVAMLMISAAVYSMIMLVFAGWACWPENRLIWSQWAADRLADLDHSSLSATNVGIRWSIVIVFGWAAFFISRQAAYIWIPMAGRVWLTVTMTGISGLFYFTPVVIGLRWFMQQTDWETTKASALGYLQLLPIVVAGLLVLKLVAVVISIIALNRQRLANKRELVQVVSIWALITLLIATSLALLIPDPRVTLVWCLAVTALMAPLTRVNALPLAVAWDRHR